MDEVVKKIAALGLPGVMFAVALSIAGAAGLAGAAAITSALAMLGGPLGMMGGIGALVAASVIADGVCQYGIDTLLPAVYEERIHQGESPDTLCKEIDSLWISEALKHKLRKAIHCSSW